MSTDEHFCSLHHSLLTLHSNTRTILSLVCLPSMAFLLRSDNSKGERGGGRREEFE